VKSHDIMELILFAAMADGSLKIEENAVGCKWVEGATDEVWKSTCSMVPFLDRVPRQANCPYCGEPLAVVRNAHNRSVPT